MALAMGPATKRAEEARLWRKKMERKVERLTRSDANMRSIIVVLIQRDEDQVKRLGKLDPSSPVEPIQTLLARLNLSLIQIAGIDEEDEEDQKPNAPQT